MVTEKISESKPGGNKTIDNYYLVSGELNLKKEWRKQPTI